MSGIRPMLMHTCDAFYVDEKGNKRFLKLFNLAKLINSQYEQTIENITEINIVKSLSHINIENYIDSGEVVYEGQRCIYMVCDFIVGETVSQKIKREGNCSVYDIKRIISGVLNGLKYLHKRDIPIIHNGLTPESIMLDMTSNMSTAKIIDFGHAQYLESRNKSFYSDGLNLFYMAPEMFKGLYSTRTDLYSVGVMMYHLLLGTLPWYVDLSKVPTQDRIARVIPFKGSWIEFATDINNVMYAYIDRKKKLRQMSLQQQPRTEVSQMKMISEAILLLTQTTGVNLFISDQLPGQRKF